MSHVERMRGFAESRWIAVLAVGNLALAGCGASGNPFSSPSPRAVVVGAHVTVTEASDGSSIQIEDPNGSHTEEYPTRVGYVKKAVVYLQGLCGRFVSPPDDYGDLVVVSFGEEGKNNDCMHKLQASNLP